MYELTLQINGRIQPMDRGDEFEDPIDEALQQCGCGATDGGGTMMQKTGEIEYCDVEISLNENSQYCMDQLMRILDEIGIPKGSFLRGEDLELSVGRLEGLAFYANGTELPDEVYETCDINYVIEQMEGLMEGIGRFYSFWQGPEDTALYFYGTSFEEMNKQIEAFVMEYPLCQKSRIEQIA